MIDEYYILRAERSGRMPAGDDRAPDGFVNEDGNLGPLRSARRFQTLESAERYIADHNTGRHRWLIQLCSRERGPSDDGDALHQLIEEIMQIPPPYRRTAYNWLRGKDVETLLRSQGDDVYDRHREALANHGIDITHPSDVVLMRPKRARIAINTGIESGRSRPRQYVAMPSQRPSAAPVLNDSRSSEDD